jgi:SpoVK/Ycf46/Vps4 family AAA+-type ATPase
MVTATDFEDALERVKPTAMAEYRLQVATHRFEDFAGIDDVIDDLKACYSGIDDVIDGL